MILLYFYLFLFSLALTASNDNYKSYKNYKIIEVIGNKTEIQRITSYVQHNYELPYHSAIGNKSKMIVAPGLEEIVKDMADVAGMSFKIIHNDYSILIQKEKERQLRFDFSWTAYYDNDEINLFLQKMSFAYPTLTKLIIGGHSYEGRPIMGLKIDSPVNSKKPIIFLEAGIHAREWIAPATITYFINELLTNNDSSILELRNTFEWHIFPVVNPDGYQYSFTTDRLWRKTRSKSSESCYGADANRNWDYNWMKTGASDDPCEYQIYAGTQAFSEIETRTLSRYITSLDNLLGYISFHSDAQMLLMPYSDSTRRVADYNRLKKIGLTSLKYGFQVNQQLLRGPATAAEILYPSSGGSMDWVRYSRGVPLVYTYELRGEQFYWPPNRIREQGDEVTQMLLGLIVEAKNQGLY